MSRVTDVVLLFALTHAEGAEREIVECVNREITGGSLSLVDSHAGGWKAMQCNVAAGALNYTDEEGVIAAARAVPWNGYGCEYAQLLVHGEDDNQFRLYEIHPEPR